MMVSGAMPMSVSTPKRGPGQSPPPELKFLSLFVPDLEAACRTYESVLGVAPSEATDDMIRRHPFATAGPAVFDLGAVKVALYQCDMRTTHPGDVGIGLCVEGSAATITERVGPAGGRVFLGPVKVEQQQREMAAFVLPDRHFFEVLATGEG
jgi:catechol 2,3-dioxygenase-like lactoylglutathione lyase family enzyme